MNATYKVSEDLTLDEISERRALIMQCVSIVNEADAKIKQLGRDNGLHAMFFLVGYTSKLNEIASAYHAADTELLLLFQNKQLTVL